jgi:hypothetical protein
MLFQTACVGCPDADAVSAASSQQKCCQADKRDDEDPEHKHPGVTKIYAHFLISSLPLSIASFASVSE